MKASDIVPQGIKVTFEFASVEQAIAWLGTKIMAGAPEAARQVAPVSGSNPPVAPATRQRKGRADKGKPRGSYKHPMEKHASVDEESPTTIAAPPALSEPVAQKAPESPPTPQAGAAPSATKEEVLALFERIFNEKGMQVGRDLLSRYGVKRVPDLPKEMYGEFAERAKKVLEGGAV